MTQGPQKRVINLGLGIQRIAVVGKHLSVHQYLESPDLRRQVSLWYSHAPLP